MGRGGTGGERTLPGLLPLDTEHPGHRGIFRTGDIEDDYHVEKEPIARGKFASVRLARHRTTGEVFAAKFVRRRRRAANLEDEARHEIAVLLLGRPSLNIVHLHQVYETRSEYVIILEFGEGGDLQRLLDDRGHFPENTVRDLMRQVLNGLGYLHQKRIAHLDIKPQNLILMGLTPEEGVKLVDFGLSRIIHEDTELTHIMGTPDYVAPEIINFEPVGLATDMWSIGVLTYVLLSGYTPFGGDTDQETFVNITQGDFDFPEEYFSNVTHQAKDFISGLLLKSPNQRLTVDQCFSHPWLSDLIDLHRYSNLSEADSADSGYSTDLCSGSPPSPGMISNGFVSTDLSQYSIPEHRQISSTPTARRSLSKQYPTIQLPRVGESDMLTNGSSDQRKPRLSTAHMSVNVLDCLQGQQQRSQCKSLRRSSLVIPRHTNDLDTSKMQDPFCLYDENQNKSRSMYLSDNFLSSPSKKKEKDSVKNPFDDNINLARPWNNLCCGSYSRALNQLTSPTPKKNKQRTNLGIRPELSCSMFELKPSCDYNSMLYNNSNSMKYELRKSKSELRGSKKDLLKTKNEDFGTLRSDIYSCSNYSTRTSKKDFVNKEPTTNLYSHDKEESRFNLRNSKHDIKSTRQEIRSSKSDLRSLKYDLNKPDLSNGHNGRSHLSPAYSLASIPYLNMSLSRLDIAHETLDNDEASEERDIVSGDCTLPRRFSRTGISPLLRGSSFHMSFRKSKKREPRL